MKIFTLIVLFGLTQTEAFATGKYKLEKFNDPVFKIPIPVKQKSIHKKQTMILVHGLGSKGSKSWDKISDELAKHYHIVAIDLPGFGQALGKLSAPVTPTSYAELVSRVVLAYAKSKVIFVGHSMGAAIGLRFVSQNPQLVDKAILIDAAGILQKAAYTKFLASRALTAGSKKIPSAKASTVSTSSLFADIMVEMVDNFPIGEKIQTLLSENVNVRIATNLLDTDFSHDIQNFRVKSLLIWGEDDPIAPVRTGQMLNFHLKQSKLIVLPNTGHSPHIQNPKKVAKLIQQWLKSPNSGEFQSQKPTNLKYVCNKKTLKKVISGAFNSLSFNGCSNIFLKNVSANSIHLVDSVAYLENIKIVSKQTGLIVDEATVMATNLVIDAGVGIQATGSKLDLAGAIIIYKEKPITGSGSLIYWSTSYQTKNGQSTKTIHKKQRFH